MLLLEALVRVRVRVRLERGRHCLRMMLPHEESVYRLPEEYMGQVFPYRMDCDNLDECEVNKVDCNMHHGDLLD